MRRILGLLLLCCFTLLLAGCNGAQCHWFRCKAPAPVVPTVSPGSRVIAIRGVGQREAEAESAIDVAPLRDPGVTAWQDKARSEEQAGHYQAAANALDQALKINPQAPDLLQDRAEEAVLLGQYPQAEALARKSWSLGSKMGPICAKNQQTIAEMRQQVGDMAGMTKAEQAVKQCHKAPLPRF